MAVVSRASIFGVLLGWPCLCVCLLVYTFSVQVPFVPVFLQLGRFVLGAPVLL